MCFWAGMANHFSILRNQASTQSAQNLNRGDVPEAKLPLFIQSTPAQWHVKTRSFHPITAFKAGIQSINSPKIFIHWDDSGKFQYKHEYRLIALVLISQLYIVNQVDEERLELTLLLQEGTIQKI